MIWKFHSHALSCRVHIPEEIKARLVALIFYFLWRAYVLESHLAINFSEQKK